MITDWRGKGGERPDFLLVGPDSVIAVCLDETAGSTFAWLARRSVARTRQRAEAAAAWATDRLRQVGERLVPADPPVRPLVILTRREALPEYSAGGVMVLNPEQLADRLQPGGGAVLLDQRDRFRLTRFFRGDQTAGKAAGDRL